MGIINNQIKPYLGEIRLNQVRLDVVQAMVNELKETKAPATIKKLKM